MKDREYALFKDINYSYIALVTFKNAIFPLTCFLYIFANKMNVTITLLKDNLVKLISFLNVMGP